MPFRPEAFIQSDGPLPILAIAALLGIGLFLVRSGATTRTKTMAGRIDKIRGSAGAPKKGEGTKRRVEERVSAKPLQNLTESEHRQIVRSYAKLGVSAENALTAFNVTRLILPVCIALAAIPIALDLLASFPAAGVLAIAAPAIIGYFVPTYVVRRAIRRRMNAVSSGLPDALELLAVCIESGLSLENGLQRVSAELKRSQPDLADELSLTWAEINILPSRDQALLNLAERVDLPSVRSVVSTLAQTLKYGTPLARSLRVVAADVRADQLTVMEEKANRLPAMMTVPVMLFIMPTIFLIIGGPAALKLMDIFYK